MPHRAPSCPGEWIEPVQGEQRLRGDVDQQVLTAVMRKFMRQGKIARLAVGPGHEVKRQGNHLVQHTKGNRRSDGGGFNQPHASNLADRPSNFEQPRAHMPVGDDPHGEE